MGRDDNEVASLRVDMNSCRRRLSYPWGNFSLIRRPHVWAQSGSLGPPFGSRFLIVRNRVKPAFALALNGGVLTPLSRPLGAPVSLSGAWRPTQTAHQPLSLPYGRLAVQLRKGGVPSAPPPPLARGLLRLPPTLYIQSHTARAGCSKAPQGLRFHVGGTGLCTSTSVSGDPTRGQRDARWTFMQAAN